ncbi:hypothetical protein SDC9_93050 [bioreactor metagenome]|uniref:Uncharacterized protein n=1 Tax=bioreactor metagenome TaxID=1076179 RepID=A0A644ZZZ7_9ZZZZ
MLGLDADAGILDFETKQDTLLVFIEPPQPQGHRSGFRKLDGVGCVVEQGLLQAGGIPHQQRKRFAAVNNQLKLLGMRAIAEDGDDIREQPLGLQRRFVEHEFSGLDLR